MWQKIKNKWCKVFGHSFNDIEFVMFKIECKALNSADLHPRIQCKVCNKVFEPKKQEEK